MLKNNRSLFITGAIFLPAMILFVICYNLFGHEIIQAMYEERALGFLNSLIKNKDQAPLEYYYKRVDVLVNEVALIYLLCVGVIMGLVKLLTSQVSEKLLMSLIIILVIIGLTVGLKQYSFYCWIGYAICFPLGFYLIFRISKFKACRQNTIPLSLKITKVVSLCLALLFIVDGVGGLAYKYWFKRISTSDWRYNIMINGWLSDVDFRKMLTEILVSNEGIGPFPPNKRYNMLGSTVTIDNLGFRKEVPYADSDTDTPFNVLYLGGSTVFGMTTNKGDISSPDMLQLLLNSNQDNIVFNVYNGGYPGASISSIKDLVLKWKTLSLLVSLYFMKQLIHSHYI